jgi:tRNA(Ile)-lysidine synthase
MPQGHGSAILHKREISVKLAQAVLACIRKYQLLQPGDRVGIAVSGGADSVALLRLLNALRPELGIVASVIHLNHKLRGDESDKDEAFVVELAAKYGYEIFCGAGDVKAFAAEKKLSVEAAARQLRYEFFISKLRDGYFNKVATAHTIDDQAETVLLKLARGAWTRGLAGIYPKVAATHFDFAQGRLQPSAISSVSVDCAIVRPLLHSTRRQLGEYLAKIGQDWREDSSNRDLRHTRNRVRHGILPRMAEHINPAVYEVLAETAEIARAEEEYWAGEIGRLLPELWSNTETGGWLNSTQLRRMPLAVRRRLVRAAAESLGLKLGFGHVEEVIAIQDGGTVALPGDWLVCSEHADVVFSRQLDGLDISEYEYELPVPGRVRVPEADIILQAVVLDHPQISGEYRSEHLIDPSAMTGRLMVRPWRAGERFWPAHTREPKKIKELLQNMNITGTDKKTWPVAASGDEVVWVKGLGVRRDFQAKGESGVLIRELELQCDD